MPNIEWDLEAIAARRRKGDGEGARDTYRPWLTVRSFATKGTAFRVAGRFGRTHHLFSARERKCYLMLAWSDSVVDIREQFPLHEITETVAIASELKVKHPSYRREGPTGRVQCAATMTTDFLVSLVDGRGLPPMVALSVKTAPDLSSTNRKVQRILEKSEIERRYWETRNVPFRFVTDAEMPRDYVANLDMLLGARDIRGLGISAANLNDFIQYLADELSSAPTVPLAAVCASADKRLNLRTGVSLALVWYALGSKLWSVDLTQRLQANKPIPPSIRFAVSTEHPQPRRWA